MRTNNEKAQVKGNACSRIIFMSANFPKNSLKTAKKAKKRVCGFFLYTKRHLKFYCYIYYSRVESAKFSNPAISLVRESVLFMSAMSVVWCLSIDVFGPCPPFMGAKRT